MADQSGTLDQIQQQVRDHFRNVAPERQAGEWEACWQRKVTPWDRLQPNPALVDALEGRKSVLDPPDGRSGDPDGGRGRGRGRGQGSRKKALVPGCGKGYDVHLLAAHGYDAVGLDSSPSAIDGAVDLVHTPGFDELYATKDPTVGRGTVGFLLGDFFNESTTTTDPRVDAGTFDLIYDYTFLCALPPPLRPAWARRMVDLLAPGGCLVCVMFPLHIAPEAGGPPHGLSTRLYEVLLANPGAEVEYDGHGHAVAARTSANGAGLVRVEEWTPARSFAAGQGSDRVGIWRKN